MQKLVANNDSLTPIIIENDIPVYNQYIYIGGEAIHDS